MATSTEMDKLLNLMTDQLINRQEVAFSESVLTWYRNNYECEFVSKPADRDTTRLAIKASIVERLVEVLNSPPRNERQKAPDWCAQVVGLQEPLKLQSDRLLEGEEYCKSFQKRNLLVVKNIMYFI